MYQIKINDRDDFAVNREKGKLVINGELVDADIASINPALFHVLHHNQSYRVEVVNFSRAEKTADIKVNGNLYHLDTKDQFDILLDQLGLNQLNAGTISDLKAPMPGMVLKVFVKEQDVLQKGDNLVVLEAMKMENIIKAPAGTTVKSVKIIPGDKVEKGQVLITFC